MVKMLRILVANISNFLQVSRSTLVYTSSRKLITLVGISVTLLSLSLWFVNDWAATAVLAASLIYMSVFILCLARKIAYPLQNAPLSGHSRCGSRARVVHMPGAMR